MMYVKVDRPKNNSSILKKPAAGEHVSLTEDILSTKEPIIDQNSSNNEMFLKMTEAHRKNLELNKMLTLEKTRADRLQKKIQFIQDNQDMFNKLREAYVSLKQSKANTEQITEPPIERSSQTYSAEQLQSTQENMTTISKQDLLEVTELVHILKNAIIKDGQRACVVLDREKLHQFRELEIENIKLKRQLLHSTSELERLRSNSGSGPREVAMLGRIIAKLANNDTNLQGLTTREDQLARQFMKKYEQDRPMKSEKQEIKIEVIPVPHPPTPFATPRPSNSPDSDTPTVDVYSTPRWARGEDIP